MIFVPTAVCRDCNEEIMLVAGFWCDATIGTSGIDVDSSFAAMCETGDKHRPKDES